jgi:hypothetical protein
MLFALYRRVVSAALVIREAIAYMLSTMFLELFACIVALWTAAYVVQTFQYLPEPLEEGFYKNPTVSFVTAIVVLFFRILEILEDLVASSRRLW